MVWRESALLSQALETLSGGTVSGALFHAARIQP